MLQSENSGASSGGPIRKIGDGNPVLPDRDRIAAAGFLSATAFQGPIPPPEFIEHYERILPGSARFFFDQVEIDAGHRRGLETKQVEAFVGDIKDGRQERRRGQIFGFVLGAILAVCGSINLYFSQTNWQSGASAFISTAGIASIITAFYYGQTKSEGDVPKRIPVPSEGAAPPATHRPVPNRKKKRR